MEPEIWILEFTWEIACGYSNFYRNFFNWFGEMVQCWWEIENFEAMARLRVRFEYCKPLGGVYLINSSVKCLMHLPIAGARGYFNVTSSSWLLYDDSAVESLGFHPQEPAIFDWLNWWIVMWNIWFNLL